MRVIIAAAGTGGHINPGIAIANKIIDKQKKSKIIFIGTTRGLENDLVPRAGFELKTIDAYGLSKAISIESLKRIYKTIKGYWQAKKIVSEFNPDIVIGTGGYICGAVIMAANKLKIPTILHESNAVPGRAIKMLSKKTNTILVSFKDTLGKIKKCKRVIYTGTPIKITKREYTQDKKIQIIKDIGLSETKPVILVFGGSQGAKKINEAILEIANKKLNKDYQIIWATGIKQYDIIKEQLDNNNININFINGIKIVPYIYNMEEIMNVSDIIVSRSGAMTITEISNLGKPSILIPLPNVSNNHQLYNAKILEKVDAAKIILDDNLSGNVLNKTISDIILNDSIKEMSQKAYGISINNVEDKIYSEIERLVSKK